MESKFWNSYTTSCVVLVQAVVTMNNFQMYRPITSPGWTLGWTWAKNEVIWAMMGAQATDQSLEAMFLTAVRKSLQLLICCQIPPYNQQIANCCTGGVMASMGKDPSTALSSFQISVGSAGNTNTTVKLPKKFTLVAPGGGYTCGPAKIIRPTRFITNDGLRVTQAMSADAHST